MWYLEHVVLQHVRRYQRVDLAYGSYEGVGKVTYIKSSPPHYNYMVSHKINYIVGFNEKNSRI
jgi:hypothetical protein